MSINIKVFDKDGKEANLDLKDIIDDKDTWVSGKSKIISYKGCKKISDKCGYRVSRNPAPNLFCVPTEDNKMQHIWGLFLEHKNNNEEYVFSEGEASRMNTGKYEKVDSKVVYKELTEIDGKYRSAMAYKRAFCRGVLMLSGLDKEGFYSEVESKDFSKNSGDTSSSEQLDYNNL